MTVDGRQVRMALSKRLRPELLALGFEKFDVRRSWRRNETSVDLITFRFESSYSASVQGCTTLSFSCIAGVYYPAADDEPVEWAVEAHLTFRALLGKTIRQPFFRHDVTGSDRPYIWYVFEDGNNLDAVIEDLAKVIFSQGIPLIEQFDSPERALSHLQQSPETEPDFGKPGIRSQGKLGSPGRVHAIEKLELLTR